MQAAENVHQICELENFQIRILKITLSLRILGDSFR